MSFYSGFYNFNNDEGLNFQLNRFYCSGFLTYDELIDIGCKVTDFESWIDLFTELAEKAETDGDAIKAATCYRAAQFYTVSNVINENGESRQKELYEKCRVQYDIAYNQIEGLKYTQIPYQDEYLPVYYRLASGEKKGTVVLHGGYDSFAQEFMGFTIAFSDQGYDTYLFEGPGQGEVLYRCGIKMTHEWERPTGAVLDFFDLSDVTLIGISLGGYLATRAAAYDSRISRLIMYDLIYDFYGAIVARMGKTKGKLFNKMTSDPNHLLWKPIEKKLRRNYFTNWLLHQGYLVYEGVSTPYEYFNYIKRFNTRNISAKIKQDTLVLAGKKDIYTIFYDQQLAALKNAKSVTGRLFTAEENADHHCQVGNLQLVLDVMMNWIKEKTAQFGTELRESSSQ